ncbi:MAG: HNH nuclease family protein [Gammaproteobacteria bacterium]|nr:HNH nuclease family protein [Gammaproteobacteria bacterium]
MTYPTGSGGDKLHRIVAAAHQAKDKREQGYRERSLKMYPWICGRCSREFDRSNVQELTVHHRDHNHDNNPQDGSNWELLCVYCHDNEHSRLIDNDGRSAGSESASNRDSAGSHNPFADLGALLKSKK